MAHWAELDDNNVVIRVTVGDNNDPAGDEGYQWLLDNLGGRWIKTSYNSYGGKHYAEVAQVIETTPGVFETIFNRVESGKPHLRYNYAGPGYLYDPIRDAFIPPKPDAIVNEDGTVTNWVLNEDTCLWEGVTE